MSKLPYHEVAGLCQQWLRLFVHALVPAGRRDGQDESVNQQARYQDLAEVGAILSLSDCHCMHMIEDAASTTG